MFRRMLILAAEDVGLADPQAIGVVTACADAFDRVGLPEGRFHLAQAALYLATAPECCAQVIKIRKLKNNISIDFFSSADSFPAKKP